MLATAGLANAGVGPVELKELVYHAVPYVGLARAFDYLHAVNDILIAAGVELPLLGRRQALPKPAINAAIRCRSAAKPSR